MRARQFYPALITDQHEGLSTPDGVGILYIPRCPDSRSGMLLRFAGPVTDDRRNLTHELCHALPDLQVLGRWIAARLPGRLPRRPGAA